MKEDRKRELKKKKELEELKKKYPEVERIEELKGSLISSRIFTGIGVLLIIFSIYAGWVREGFFLLSLEFIIGLIISITGMISTSNKLEKIKDLEMNLKKIINNEKIN